VVVILLAIQHKLDENAKLATRVDGLAQL
jgi:hypothetical protein